MDPAPEPNAPWSALEQRLLEAARHDRIPDALGARMAEGLGLPAGAALHTGLAGGGALAKIALWGALPLALAAGVAGWSATRSTPRAEPIASVPRPAASSIAVVQPPVVRPSLPPVIGEAAPSAAAPIDAPAPPAAVAAARRTDDLRGDGALRAEIALLDRARGALQQNQSARALRLLDQHRQRFTHPTLAPEAAALRIDALRQRGAFAQAETLSAQFASAYPTHPLRERMSAPQAGDTARPTIVDRTR